MKQTDFPRKIYLQGHFDGSGNMTILSWDLKPGATSPAPEDGVEYVRGDVVAKVRKRLKDIVKLYGTLQIENCNMRKKLQERGIYVEKTKGRRKAGL